VPYQVTQLCQVSVKQASCQATVPYQATLPVEYHVK